MDNDITCNNEYYIDDEFHPHRSEDFCLTLQRMQPEQIERNRRMMKAGMIEFDDYEEVE